MSNNNPTSQTKSSRSPPMQAQNAESQSTQLQSHATENNINNNNVSGSGNVEKCDSLANIDKCQTYSVFSSNLVTPYLTSLKKEVADLITSSSKPTPVDQCTVLNDVEKCNSYPTFSSNIVTPYLKQVKTDLMGLIKTGASQASAAAEKASDQLTNVITVLNSIPSLIRDNSIFASKVVSVNLQALTDILASEANPKVPPVTKDNMVIIKYLSEKQNNIYKQLLEHGNKTKDLPAEKRAYDLLIVDRKYVKPLVVGNK